MNATFPEPLTEDAPAQTSRLSWASQFYWAWPAALTLVLAGYQVTRPALWADELATWGAVRLGWGALFRLLSGVDAVVGPYYVLMKAWTGVAGTSTLALRLPSVLAMTATAGLLAVLGARLVDRRVGVLAGLTLALVPVTSRYAQEARPYAFVLLFAVLATLALTWFLSRPGWVAGIGYALSIALLGAFHLIALLLLVAHAIVVALRGNRRPAIGWLIASTAGVLPLLPLAWLGQRQSGQISWLAKAGWRTLVATPDTIFGAGVVAGLIIGLGALAVSRKPPAVLAFAWALGPILALFAIGEFTPLFWARYLLYTLPGFVLLAALTLGRLRPAHAAAILVGLALLAAPAQTGIRTPDGHNHATTAAAGIIAANVRAGDGIAYALDEPVVPWEARDIVARYVPAGKRPRDVFAVTPQRTGDRLTATECPDLLACLGDTPRLWVLRYENLADPLTGIGAAKATLISNRFRLDRVWLVRGLTVALYTRG